MWWNFTDESWLNGMLYCCIDCIDCIHTVANQYSSFWCTSCTSSFWKRQMSILGWWPETVIFGPVFQVQPQIQMSCSQLHKRAERIGCMLMEKGRLNTGDHVALIYPPGQSHKLEPPFKTIQCEGFCNLLWRQIISSSDTMIWCFILSSLWKTIQCGGFCPSLWNIATTLCTVKKWL